MEPTNSFLTVKVETFTALFCRRNLVSIILLLSLHSDRDLGQGSRLEARGSRLQPPGLKLEVEIKVEV